MQLIRERKKQRRDRESTGAGSDLRINGSEDSLKGEIFRAGNPYRYGRKITVTQLSVYTRAAIESPKRVRNTA